MLVKVKYRLLGHSENWTIQIHSTRPVQPTRMSSDVDQCCMDDSDDCVFRASTESDSDNAVFRPGTKKWSTKIGRKKRQQSNGNGPPIIVYILGSRGENFQTARLKAFGEDCGLWFVVCGLWFVVCGLRFVVCGLWIVVCGLWFVVCGLWFVVCGLWFVDCGLWIAVCGLWFVVCGLRFVVCGLWIVVCGLWFVVCGSWFPVLSNVQFIRW
jgi:hypothetical protein